MCGGCAQAWPGALHGYAVLRLLRGPGLQPPLQPPGEGQNPAQPVNRGGHACDSCNKRHGTAGLVWRVCRREEGQGRGLRSAGGQDAFGPPLVQPSRAEQGGQRVLAAAGPRRGHHVVEQEKPPPAEGRQCPLRTGGLNGPLCGSPFSRSQEQMRKKFVLTHILGTFAFRTNTVCTPEIFFQVPVGVGRAGTLPEAGLSCIFGTKRRKKIWTPKLVGPLSPPPRKVQCGGIPEFIPGVLLMPRPTSPHAQQSSHSIPGH